MMRAAAVALALLLAACQGDRDRIIADVCKPINEDETASFEKLVAAKGYDRERAQKVCHQYVVDQREEAIRMLRGLRADQSSPYDAH